MEPLLTGAMTDVPGPSTILVRLLQPGVQTQTCYGTSSLYHLIMVLILLSWNLLSVFLSLSPSTTRFILKASPFVPDTQFSCCPSKLFPVRQRRKSGEPHFPDSLACRFLVQIQSWEAPMQNLEGKEGKAVVL